MKNLFKKIKTILNGLLAIIKIAPFPFLLNILSRILSIISGAEFVKYSGMLIDSIVSYIKNTPGESPTKVMVSMVILGAFCCLLTYISTISDRKISDCVNISFSKRFLNTIKNSDYLLYTKKEYQDKMQAAQGIMNGAVTWMCMYFVNCITSLITVFTYCSIITPNSILITIILGAGYAVINSVLMMKTFKKCREVELALIEKERVNGYYQSLIISSYSAKEIKLFGLFDDLQNKWKDTYIPIRNDRNFINKKNLNSSFFINTLGIVLSSALLLFAFVTNPGITPGKFTVLYSAYFIILLSVKDIGSLVNNFYKSILYIDLLDDFEDFAGNSLIKINPANSNSNNKYVVEVKNVDFSYDDVSNTLNNINLNIKKGESVAIVGNNGSGKTTLVNIILGLYYPKKGEVYVNNVCPYFRDVQDPKIVMVAQNFGIYEALSLKNNITFDNKNEDKLKDALEAVGLGEYNIKLEDIIGNSFNGINLSGGQWQRIALIRPLFTDAEIVIFDEPTASLDPVLEVEIFNKFMKLYKDKTIIIISHRLGVIKKCDNIIVLNNGEIIESGTHDELIGNDKFYKKMYDAQASWYR